MERTVTDRAETSVTFQTVKVLEKREKPRIFQYPQLHGNSNGATLGLENDLENRREPSLEPIQTTRCSAGEIPVNQWKTFFCYETCSAGLEGKDWRKKAVGRSSNLMDKEHDWGPAVFSHSSRFCPNCELFDDGDIQR